MDKQGLNYCDNCNIYVDSALGACPLCQAQLTLKPQENGLYPPVEEKQYIDRSSVASDLFVFLTFLFIGGAILLNVIFWKGTPWFLAVAAPLLYTWILVRLTILSDVYPGAKAFWNMVGIMGMMLAFDYVGGWLGWSYEIVFPFILVAGIVYIDFYSWIHKSLWRDNLVYALLFVGLCFIPLILYANDIMHVFSPMFASTVAGGLTVLGIFRFTIRYLREEMHRRFHI